MTDKRKFWALWVIMVLIFLGLLVFEANTWMFVAVAALFVGYTTWTTTGYMIKRHDFVGSDLRAWAVAVGVATCKVLGCLGLVWLILWLGRYLAQILHRA